MERHVVEDVQEAARVRLGPVAVCRHVGLLDPLAETVVAAVEGRDVASDGLMSVDHGELRLEVGLVEVVGVGHESALERRVQGKQRVGAHEHGDAAGAASGPGRGLLVEGNVRGHHDGVAAVPRARLDPVDGVEEGTCTPVACVDCVDTLQARVAGGLEELGQHSLDGLGFVD